MDQLQTNVVQGKGDTNATHSLTPKRIVEALDKYIIGQGDAKRSVAIALRNRWRRQQVHEDLRDEIAPKNIIMIGPTGVGKTEIARRLSKLTSSPFIKVEASKFTEVGYVGRDVESIIRDLVEIAKNMVREERTAVVQERAESIAEDNIIDLLLPPPPNIGKGRPEGTDSEADGEHQQYFGTREKFRSYFREGKLDERTVEIDTQDRSSPMIEVISNMGAEDMDINLKDVLGNFLPKKTKRTKMKVKDAFSVLKSEASQKLIDMEMVKQDAIERVEQSGIVFIDEIDKVAGRESRGPDVSREGVQRDLLPIVEGCTVTTKYGTVRTDHILFIAAGAFHISKPSELIPEIQGRFPIRVNLNSLGQEEFVRILTEPKNALIRQYCELLKTEGVTITYTEDAISEIARIAQQVNERTENIGARRLHTVMEKILDDISFDVPDCSETEFIIDARYVTEKLKAIVKDEDLSRYIL